MCSEMADMSLLVLKRQSENHTLQYMNIPNDTCSAPVTLMQISVINMRLGVPDAKDV